ncbi:MAG: hypothetical protein ACRD0Y_14055, partial [Terriglobales bacterium]
TWTPLTIGLPSDEYVESVRQDPSDSSLMFVATSATVYYSLDGGQQWQLLKLNLPAVRVTDLEIQPQQHAVVISTFGRAFWVLDNLQYLEQLGTAHVSSDAAHLFKPQESWQTTGGGYGFGGGGAAGQRKPAGVTIFFSLPSSYTAGTPVKLSFSTAAGEPVNTISLPQKPSAGRGGFFRMARRPAKLHPGVNRFQWNMRYPTATVVKGLYHSGFGASEPTGPEVMPGTYTVALNVGGQTQKQSFVIKLDPNWHTSQADLQQRFDLLTRLHKVTGQLDASLNQALAAREALEKAGQQSSPAYTRLNRDIDSLVDLRIQSGEGGLVYPPRVRAWLSFISQEVSLAPVQPTPAMVKVANEYIQDAQAGVTLLKADVAAAHK